MLVEGTIHKILQKSEGIGKSGHWQKQQFIIQPKDTSNQLILITAWNSEVDIIRKINTGSKIKLHIKISAREYQNKWYNDITAHSIEFIDQDAPKRDILRKTIIEEPNKEKPNNPSYLFPPTDDGLDLPF